MCIFYDLYKCYVLCFLKIVYVMSKSIFNNSIANNIGIEDLSFCHLCDNHEFVESLIITDNQLLEHCRYMCIWIHLDVYEFL